MISKLEALAEQRGLLSSLRRSHAGLVAVVTTVLTCGSPTNALANGKHHGHTSHLIGRDLHPLTHRSRPKRAKQAY
jgi:hypothetical protein